MEEIRKIARGKKLCLGEEIAIGEGEVSTKNLYASKHFRYTLVAMGAKEEISAETMPDPRYFEVLEGKIVVDYAGEEISLEKGRVLALAANSFYAIRAEEGSIFVEVEYKGEDMEKKTINHIERAKTFVWKDQIFYGEGQVKSQNLALNDGLVMSLMAFDKGESLSAHKAPGDALVNVLEGLGRFTIDGVPHDVAAGESILLPGNILHAVEALEAFKMLITIVK